MTARAWRCLMWWRRGRWRRRRKLRLPPRHRLRSPLSLSRTGPVTAMSDMAVATGKWYGLGAIFQDKDLEFDTWSQIVQTEGGVACPVCGEPLSSAPPSEAGSGVTKFCRFAGDHRFWAPDDVVVPRHGVRMGRFG